LVDIAALESQDVDLFPRRREEDLGALRVDLIALGRHDLAGSVANVVTEDLVEERLGAVVGTTGAGGFPPDRDRLHEAAFLARRRSASGRPLPPVRRS